MINLLPIKEKEKLIWEKKLRLVLIIGVLIIICLLSLWMALLAVKIQVSTQAKTQISLTQAELTKAHQLNEIKDKIGSINNLLSEMNKVYDNQIFLSDSLINISEILSRKVYLKTFIYEKDKFQISISGQVKDLEDLNDLRERFKEQGDFQKVDFSIPRISTEITDKEIEFRTNILIK